MRRVRIIVSAGIYTECPRGLSTSREFELRVKIAIQHPHFDTSIKDKRMNDAQKTFPPSVVNRASIAAPMDLSKETQRDGTIYDILAWICLQLFKIFFSFFIIKVSTLFLAKKKS